MRVNDTTDGQFTVDLIVKVEGEGKLLTSINGPYIGEKTQSPETGLPVLTQIPTNLPREYDTSSPDTSVNGEGVIRD